MKNSCFITSRENDLAKSDHPNGDKSKNHVQLSIHCFNPLFNRNSNQNTKF